MSEENINSKEFKDIIRYIEDRKYIEAETSLKKILNERKNEFYPHQLLGILYSKIEDYEKALQHYEESIKINPKNPGIYFDLGNMYRSLNNNDKSIEFFLKAIELNPNIVDAYLNIAKIYEKQKKLVDANKFFLKALSLNKNYIPSNKSYSNFLLKAGEISKGLSYQYKYLGIIRFNKEDLEII